MTAATYILEPASSCPCIRFDRHKTLYGIEVSRGDDGEVYVLFIREKAGVKAGSKFTVTRHESILFPSLLPQLSISDAVEITKAMMCGRFTIHIRPCFKHIYNRNIATKFDPARLP